MKQEVSPPARSITWRDLTVPDAAVVRDSCGKVVGWKAAPLSMGDYDDYCMTLPDSGETVAGICHARGCNAKLPPQWLIYITVADLEHSARACVENGGKIIDGPRDVGGKTNYVLQDPAGAYAAIISR